MPSGIYIRIKGRTKKEYPNLSNSGVKKGNIPWNKGKKTGIIPKTAFKKGTIPWDKGKKLSKDHIEKLRIAKLGKIGKLANNWQGGKTPRNKHYLSNPQYKKLRSDVFQRDGWACQTCGIRGNETGGYLEVHHIKSWAKYPKLRFDVNNCVTLCRECHKLTDNYKNKKIKNCAI